MPMSIARPLAVNKFSTQQPATLHLNVAGWRAAAFILAAPRTLPLAPLPLLSWPRAIPFHCPEPSERFFKFFARKNSWFNSHRRLTPAETCSLLVLPSSRKYPVYGRQVEERLYFFLQISLWISGCRLYIRYWSWLLGGSVGVSTHTDPVRPNTALQHARAPSCEAIYPIFRPLCVVGGLEVWSVGVSSIVVLARSPLGGTMVTITLVGPRAPKRGP